MSDSPDITKVVSLLMQNPEIIANISAMLSGGNTTNTENLEPPKTQESEIEVSTSPPLPIGKKRSNRSALLGAMKPYLRSSRASAIDSMISILDVLEVMRGR